MKKLLSTVLCVSVLGMTSTASAAPGDASLGIKAGTLGLGLELTFEAMDQLNLRLGGNYFKVGAEVEVEDNDYDLDVKLNSFTALADWYVTDSQFRVTAGAFINENGLNGVALPSNTYEIDDVIYTATEVGTLSADVRFNSVAPYAGIGWGNPLSDDSDLSFMFDLGVVFAGKPTLDITSTGGTLSNDPTLQANIAQAEQDFRDTDEIKLLRFYPVVSIGLNYRF